MSDLPKEHGGPSILDSYIDSWLKEHFAEYAEKWWTEYVAQEQFKAEQADVNWQWNRLHADATPPTGVEFEVPLGYIKGEKKTYVRVYNIDRNQDIWERKYE